MKRHNTIEILYVAEASDNRGRRVLIREAGLENTLWPGGDIQDVDIKLLGIGGQRERIEDFLSSESRL
jgi:hypothetical protein